MIRGVHSPPRLGPGVLVESFSLIMVQVKPTGRAFFTIFALGRLGRFPSARSPEPFRWRRSLPRGQARTRILRATSQAGRHLVLWVVFGHWETCTHLTHPPVEFCSKRSSPTELARPPTSQMLKKPWSKELVGEPTSGGTAPGVNEETERINLPPFCYRPKRDYINIYIYMSYIYII